MPVYSQFRLQAIRELMLLRIRTFLREPEALFWTFGFPILMAMGLGLAFNEEPTEQVAVVVERGSSAEDWAPRLGRFPELAVRLLPGDSAFDALRTGTAAVVLTGRDTLTLHYDPARPESRSARVFVDAAVQEAAGVQRMIEVRGVPERRRGNRYIDWVIPGLIGMNVMSTSMWGLGFGLVQMRQMKQLKRLSSTPIRRSDFLLSQILARMTFLILEIPPIVLFAWLAFGVQLAGPVVSLAFIVLLGAISFAGLGLLCASRARTIEGVSGLLNVVMLPMFVLSGVFFSASRYPDALQPLIRLLPLTALNDALRAVYNDGLSLFAVPVPLLILSAWALFAFAVSLRVFRWQ